MRHFCDSCRWYDTATGFCRRHAPRTVISQAQLSDNGGGSRQINIYTLGEWPRASPTDWCGEHSDIPEEDRVAKALRNQ